MPPQASISVTDTPHLDLFAKFESALPRFSNTIQLFDAIPKFVVSPKAIDKSQPVWRVQREFQLADGNYTIAITPAILFNPTTKKQRQVFPGVKEELVDEALRKIATRRSPVHVELDSEAGASVVFTLYELRKELADLGHSYNHVQIREALEVLTGCMMEITLPNSDVIKSPYYPISVTRPNHKKRTQTKLFVMFHMLVSKAIYEGNYRQYDYETNMRCPCRLARWLHKRLVQRFTQASIMTSYDIMVSTVMSLSGMGPYKQRRDEIRAVKSALEKLVELKVIGHYEMTSQYDPQRSNRILDAKVTISATREFADQQKRANKLHSFVEREIFRLHPKKPATDRRHIGNLVQRRLPDASA